MRVINTDGTMTSEPVVLAVVAGNQTPPAGFTSTDRFVFTIEDEPYAQATGTIEVQVLAGN